MQRSFGGAMLWLALATPAFAHTGIGSTAGFSQGFFHPLSGMDHVLAMVAVGVFAAQLGGRALWLVPAAFVSIMALSGAVASTGLHLPYAEIGIALSVVVLGVVVALRATPPLAAAMSLVAFFAVFHGYAHGAEMPDMASGLAYGAGFVLATAGLHAAGVGLGIGFGIGLSTAGRRGGSRIAQIGGSLMALAGIGLLSGVI